MATTNRWTSSASLQLRERLQDFNEDKLLLIKEMFERDNTSIPKDFLAHYLLSTSESNNWSRVVFFKTFAWFVKDVGLPGYYGVGMSKEEVGPDTDISSCHCITIRFIFFRRDGKFINDFSLEATKAWVEMFTKCTLEKMLMGYVLDYWKDDPHPERWEKLKIIVETLRSGFNYYHADDSTRADDGSCLIGHCLLLSIVKGKECVVEKQHAEEQQIIAWIKEYQPDAFLVQNDDGRTMLDIVLNRPRYNHENEIIPLFLQEGPEACLIPGPDGRLPLHVAVTRDKDRFKKGDLVASIFDAAPSAASAKCPVTGLYPFQLAASRHRLSMIYRLLRQSPFLVADGITADNNEYDNPEYLAIAKQEIELVRIRNRHRQIEEDMSKVIRKRKRQLRETAAAV